MCKKVFKNPIVKTLATIALTAAGVPAPLAAAGTSLASGGTPLQALGSAAGSYIGGNLAGGQAGPAGTVGASLQKAGLSGLAESLPGSIATANLQGALGSFAGSSIGESMTAPAPKPSQDAGPAVFSPSRPSEMEAPAGLNGLDPNQATTSIASRGLYGGGAGPQEQGYFANLLQRRLFDQGNFDSPYQINPVEEQYLRQGLGLSFGQDTRSLLQALQSRKA